MLKAKAELLKADYVFYLDVDLLFVGAVGAEVFGDLAAAFHPEFYGKPRWSYTYENRPDSRPCVRGDEGTHYYYGAFQGGRCANLGFGDGGDGCADRRRRQPRDYGDMAR